MQKNNSRIYYLDILRVIACLSVILIHSSMHYVTKDIGSFNFWIGNIFDSIARVGVPIFVMISGTLMLNENYDFSKEKLKKHIKKMIIFFIFWSILYCLIFNVIEPVIIKHKSIHWMQIIKSLVKGHFHLWFIYLIIGLYLIVPLLRLWVKKENKKYIEYFIILSIIFTFIIPQIISISNFYTNNLDFLTEVLENNFQLTYIGGFTTYFILGWYINNYNLKNNRIIYLLGFVGLLVSIVGTYILSITTNTPIQMYQNLSINILLQSIAVFLFIKNKFINIKEMDNKIINSISKNSLGIYAIHIIFISFVFKILTKYFNYAIINIPLLFVITFILSYITTIILSKISFFKKTIL